jgi:hypothetical protein
MRSAAEIGLKITAAVFPLHRRVGGRGTPRGMGCSRPEIAWARRVKRQEEEQRAGSVGRD